ncbi:MAG: amidase family protein, partial [Tuberibacillus sp.]
MTIEKWTANELIQAYKNKTLSPVEVVDELYKKIAAENPALNAFVTLNEEEARKHAQAAEHAYITETARSLEGIPIAIK